MKMPPRLILVTIALIHGCVTTSDIDEGFRRIDRAWQLEYQKTEDLYRARVIEASYSQVFALVRQTLLDLEMPIQSADFGMGVGVIRSENEAPKPLTDEEWQQVVEVEGPRVKELGGWMFRISDDADGYVVMVEVTMKPLGDNTFVLLEYALDMPNLRRSGITPSRHAPPLAVQLGAIKFWTQLEENLAALSLPGPRKRQPTEIIAAILH